MKHMKQFFFLYIHSSRRWGIRHKRTKTKKQRNKSCYNSQSTRCDVPYMWLPFQQVN